MYNFNVVKHICCNLVLLVPFFLWNIVDHITTVVNDYGWCICFPTNDIGDVRGVLLVPGAIRLLPSGTGLGSSRVISPFLKFHNLHMTSCAAYLPPKFKMNMPSVRILSRTGACSAGRPCSCFWRADLFRLVVLTKPSKLTRARGLF
jgi:hypothetical protein